jgi:predicted MFS family arabinose efflux permease
MRTPPNVAIRRLAVARFISVGGSMAAYTALIDLVFRRTHGSTVALSLTILLTMGASGFFSPIGGVVADRWDRKRAMIASDLASGALFVVLAFVGPTWLILSVAFLTAVAATPFRAGSTAAIPNIVQDEALIARANGHLWIGTTLGITLGPAIGGVLVGWIGAGPVFVLNALSFAVSAAIVWSIRAPFRGVADSEAEEGDTGGVMAGVRFLRQDRVQLVLTVAWMVLLLGMGMGIVADRPVATIFSEGAIGFGVMLGLYGVGAVIGSWLASRLTAATEPPALVTGFVVAGLAGIGIWLASAFWIVLACNFVWGVSDAVTRVAKSGILQRRTPDAVRGRVSGANEATINLGLMAGFLIAGPTIAVLGAQGTYAAGGLAALGAAALASTVVASARGGAAEVVRVEPPPPPLPPWD